MLLICTKRHHRSCFAHFQRDYASAERDHVRVVSYEHLMQWDRFPPATYLLADLDRVRGTAFPFACRLASLIQRQPERASVINRPWRFHDRIALSRRLVAAGINWHRVHRADALPADVRFPVFLKRRRGHLGAESDVLPDRASLEQAMVHCGRHRRNWLVIEFCDTRRPDGLFAKYSAFLIDGEVIPKHVFVQSAWEVKLTPKQPHPAQAELERHYLTDTSHHDIIRRVFALAGIEFGRIDYSLEGDQIRVWEINTNPQIAPPPGSIPAARWELQVASLRRLRRALLRLARRHTHGPGLAWPGPGERWLWRWFSDRRLGR